MLYAIKTAIDDPSAETWAFDRQKTMYGGKRIAEGDTVFVFASENEGGPGLIACAVVTAVETLPRRPGVERQTPRGSLVLRRTALARRRLGRAELRPFDDWREFYRQATNKIVGVSDAAGAFLRGYFQRLGRVAPANPGGALRPSSRPRPRSPRR